ncbi:MAG: AtzG-like protein [Pseudomonadota bacterium]
MNEHILLAYVHSASALQRIPLPAAQAERVAAHLQRTAAMAALLDAAELAPHDEVVEIYCPAPFPPEAPTTAAEPKGQTHER